MNLRIPLDTVLSNDSAIVDLRLRDGTVIQQLAIDRSGHIVGKIVGGHEGVDHSPLSFKQEDIEAYRLWRGFAARVAAYFGDAVAIRLGLAKWRRV